MTTITGPAAPSAAKTTKSRATDAAPWLVRQQYLGAALGLKALLQLYERVVVDLVSFYGWDEPPAFDALEAYAGYWIERFSEAADGLV